jgi:hypothetical protein
MSISNGINSDSFSRADVIRTYQVVQYFGGILTQYPIVLNLEYNSTTGIITANGITSFQATSGTTQTTLSINGATSNSATRPGANVSIAAGNGTGGSAAGQVAIQSGTGAGASGTTGLTITNQSLSLRDQFSTDVSVSGGGLFVAGGNNDGGEISFVSGANAAATAGRPIYFGTDSGKIFEMWEETFGTQKIGFFGQTPLSAKPTITGSRGGNVALGNLLTALAALGLITNSTT